MCTVIVSFHKQLSTPDRAVVVRYFDPEGFDVVYGPGHEDCYQLT